MKKFLKDVLGEELLILPVAYRGHAITFIRCGHFWAKCDRGENSLKEGSVNIYRMSNPHCIDADFLKHLLYDKQSEGFCS